MKRFVIWFDEFLPPWPRAFFYAFVTGSTFYFAAYLSYLISEQAKDGPYALAVKGVVLVAGMVVIIFARRMINIARENFGKRSP